MTVSDMQPLTESYAPTLSRLLTKHTGLKPRVFGHNGSVTVALPIYGAAQTVIALQELGFIYYTERDENRYAMARVTHRKRG